MWTSGSFGFAWVHCGGPSCRQVNWVSRGFTRARLGVVGIKRGGLGHSGATRSRRVHSGSRGFTCALGNVALFICVHVVSLGRT